MKKYLLVTIGALLVLSTTAKAGSTWGIGVGPLYGGLGFNFGKTTPSSFAYGALGCIGLSIGDSADTSSNDNESNCGFGLGYISTSLFTSDRHGLGLNLGITYNTAESQTEVRLRPGYHYFFNGINESGLNLGVGTILYTDDETSNDQNRDSDNVKVFFNVGYQF